MGMTIAEAALRRGLALCVLLLLGCQRSGPAEGRYRLLTVAGQPVPNSIQFASEAKTMFVDSGMFEILSNNRFRSVLATHESTSAGRAGTRVDTSAGNFIVDDGRFWLDTRPAQAITFDDSRLYVLSSVEARFEYERVR
jgi:hypothetical protein